MLANRKLVSMKSLFLITFLLCVYCVNILAQDEQKVCISQAAANQCAANTRELTAANEKIAVLESALNEKDKTIEELKETNRKNVLDLTNRIDVITAEAAHEKGRRVQLENDKVFWSEIVKVAIQNTRKKCVVSILFC